MRCLFCVFRNKKNSVKCNFCDYYLEKNREMKSGLAYLENGFNRVFLECDAIEEKVGVITGFVFKRHKYSVDELLESGHMEKIDAFCAKIKDDVDRWEAAGKLSLRLKLLYNEKALEVRGRVDRLNYMVRERQPTFWERIAVFFQHIYHAVVRRLPLFVQGLLTNRKKKAINQVAA
jgi:hypothetical protein